MEARRSGSGRILGLEVGEVATLAGRVGTWESRRTRTGELFVKADLILEDGSRIRCVWWEARRAPREGSHVQVRGEVRGYAGALELHARETRALGDQLPEALENRLLRYYIACVEAEQLRQVEFAPEDEGKRFVLLTHDREGIVTGEEPAVPLVQDPRLERWALTRIMAGPAEQVYAGYPLVAGERERDGRPTRVLSPLFFLPLSLRRAAGGFEVVLEGSFPELNVYALELLGLTRDEREGLVSAVEELEDIRAAASALDRVGAWVELLGKEGLIPEGFQLRPEALEPVVEGSGISNSAMLYAGERGAVIRNLVQDLEDLAAQSPDLLRQGPLGVLLGAQPAPRAVPPQPQPCVLPTNLAQDQAITNALHRTFTVVTGPPGTGKSQVLVNAVAAAMARGESVLFASKNNQAVDVVFQRLSEVSARATPIRAGASRFRGEVALQIQNALARRVEPARFGAALEAWRSKADGLAPTYANAAQREELERLLEERDKDYARALQQAPEGVTRIDHPEVLLERLAEIREFLEVVAKRPRFLPWAKARWRRAKDRLETLWPEIVRGLGSLEELPSAPDAPTVERCRELGLSAIRLKELRSAVEEVRSRLRELPDRWELDDEIFSEDEGRRRVGRELFEAAWARCLGSASAEDRAAAQNFAEGFARLATGQGGRVGTLLALVPNVLRVFPVWGVTNLSARSNFPLEGGLFDLVVIDEASQCDLASAIPLLYRAKRALIIGDPKQLIHVTSLRPEADAALARRWGLSEEEFAWFSFRDRSLFGLASARVGEAPLFLDQHFRSRLAIISFSNDHFYGSRLTVLTDESKGLQGPAVQWVNVRGRFGRGPRGRSVVNHPEVEAVLEELRRLSAELDPGMTSIGVVTPYRAHAEAIRERVARSLPELGGSLVVASAHRFQGDERDVIVFSPAVSADMPEYHLTFAGDPNLVNVAITRARRRLIVVGDREACLASPTVLRDLARYVEDLDRGGFQSPLERTMYEGLVEARIPVQVGLEVDGHRLDLAVVQGDIRIDVECDGAAFHRDRRADAVRDETLRRAGWVVLRFGGREIQRDLEGCVRAVEDALKSPGQRLDGKAAVEDALKSPGQRLDGKAGYPRPDEAL